MPGSFNTYGPNACWPDDGRVVSNFHRPGACGANLLPSTGEGSQTRSFCFVA